MRKIWWFCDNCKELVATQKAAKGYLIEEHLNPMAEEEWCSDCVDAFRQSLRTTPNVHDTAYEHGE